MAYEALIVMGLLALLTFITRLWPILLLIILGIFAAVIRLLFLSSKEVKEDRPMQALPAGQTVPNQPDMETMAFMIVQRRITQILRERYPDVRWIWENPGAKEDLFAGRQLYVLLNRAGGYRRGKVMMQGLQVFDVEVQETAQADVPIVTEEEPAPSVSADEEPIDGEPAEKEEKSTEAPVREDFGLLAFQWVEAHILDISGQCNEAIASGQHEIFIPENELPVRESWDEICRELSRNELPDTEISETGICIKF